MSKQVNHVENEAEHVFDPCRYYHIVIICGGLIILIILINIICLLLHHSLRTFISVIGVIGCFLITH